MGPMWFAARAPARWCAWRSCCCRSPWRASGGLGGQYEYEEEIYLELDGSATVVVNASIPALVALRGLPLDPNPEARIDRDASGPRSTRRASAITACQPAVAAQRAAASSRCGST